MDLIDRLIDKAQKLRLDSGVFIISNETGEWTACGHVFPAFGPAQEYVEGLIPDGDSDSSIIINDLGPSSLPVPDRTAGVWPREWLEEQQAKKAGTRFPKKPKKDRRLV